MRLKKLVSTLVGVVGVCGLLLILTVVFLVNPANGINDHARRLACQNRLKAIYDAIERYRADHGGAYPPDIIEVGAYMEGEYNRGPGHIPRCPGSRGDDETDSPADYAYRVPSRNDQLLPICWDGMPHHVKMVGLSDVFRWNVLYSDGHLETLDEREFRKALLSVTGEAPHVPEGVE